jgi:chromosome segregation ATPase
MTYDDAIAKLSAVVLFVDDAQRGFMSLEERVMQLEQERDALAAQVKYSRDLNDKGNMERNNLYHQNTELRSKVDALQVDRDNYRAAHDIVRDTLEKKWKELDASRAELEDVKAAHGRAVCDRDLARSDLKAFRAHVHELDQADLKLLAERNELREECDTLRRQLEAAKFDLEESNGRNRRDAQASQECVDQHRSDYSTLNTMLAACEKERDDAKEMLEIVRGELHEERSTNPSATIPVLRHIIKDYQERTRTLRTELDASRASVKRLEWIIGGLSKQWSSDDE